MPRALTPLAAAAVLMSGHQAPAPPDSTPPLLPGGSTCGCGDGSAARPAGREPGDVGLDAGEQLAALRQPARMPASSPLRSRTSLSAVRSSAASRMVRRASSRRASSITASTSRSLRFTRRTSEQLVDQLREVGGGEERVERRDVVVLVQGHGALHERETGLRQLVARERLLPLVDADLGADGLQGGGGLRVALDRRLDTGVERADLGRQLARLLACRAAVRRRAPCRPRGGRRSSRPEGQDADAKERASCVNAQSASYRRWGAAAPIRSPAERLAQAPGRDPESYQTTPSCSRLTRMSGLIWSVRFGNAGGLGRRGTKPVRGPQSCRIRQALCAAVVLDSRIQRL